MLMTMTRVNRLFNLGTNGATMTTCLVRGLVDESWIQSSFAPLQQARVFHTGPTLRFRQSNVCLCVSVCVFVSSALSVFVSVSLTVPVHSCRDARKCAFTHAQQTYECIILLFFTQLRSRERRG